MTKEMPSYEELEHKLAKAEASVAQHRRVEQELRRSEAEFRRLLESSGGVDVGSGRKGRLHLCQPAG